MFTKFLNYFRFKTAAVTPEPDSTEDSTGGLEPPEVPLVHHRIPGKSPTRRMSQPVTGSPKDQDKSTNRRASEGNEKKWNAALPRTFGPQSTRFR